MDLMVGFYPTGYDNFEHDFIFGSVSLIFGTARLFNHDIT